MVGEAMQSRNSGSRGMMERYDERRGLRHILGLSHFSDGTMACIRDRIWTGATDNQHMTVVVSARSKPETLKEEGRPADFEGFVCKESGPW